MLHEHGQEPELERRQLHVAVARDDAALRKVDPQVVVAVVARHLGFAARTTKQGLDARQELLPPERLRDVVVGASGETAHLLELLRSRGQHDHGHVGEVADSLERLVPVHPRHRHVEDDERRR